MRAAKTLRPRHLVLAGLLVISGILSVSLSILALQPMRVVVVPGIQDSQILLVNEVPDSAVQRFGLLYLYHFDNYTPATVEERSNYILRYVSPEHQEAAARSLTERAQYVLRAKESSQLSLPPPGKCKVHRMQNGVVRFEAEAERNIYIAGELKSHGPVRYLIDLTPAIPTDQEPYGFQVVGQSIRALHQDPRGKRGDR